MTNTNTTTESIESKLDVLFEKVKNALFELNHEEAAKNLNEAEVLIQRKWDWGQTNRLKVYQGLHSMSIRDFKQAANLFLGTISTFKCHELCDYKTLVGYTVISAILTQPLVELESKFRNLGIFKVLQALPDIQEYFFSLYNCQYAKFFEKLAWVENYLKSDRYLAPHYEFYIREMRLLAYAHLIGSHRSLSLTYMSQTFGVSVEFVESELAKLIAANRLNCKIDKVRGVVETTRLHTNSSVIVASDLRPSNLSFCHVPQYLAPQVQHMEQVNHSGQVIIKYQQILGPNLLPVYLRPTPGDSCQNDCIFRLFNNPNNARFNDCYLTVRHLDDLQGNMLRFRHSITEKLELYLDELEMIFKELVRAPGQYPDPDEMRKTLISIFSNAHCQTFCTLRSGYRRMMENQPPIFRDTMDIYKFNHDCSHVLNLISYNVIKPLDVVLDPDRY